MAKSGTAGLSIIVPLFNEARGLEALHQRMVGRRIMTKRKLAVEIV